MYGVYMRYLPGLCRCFDGRARRAEEVSSMCNNWRTFQTVSAGHQIKKSLATLFWVFMRNLSRDNHRWRIGTVGISAFVYSED